MAANMRRPRICRVAEASAGKIGSLRGPGRRITVLALAPKHGQQFVRRPEVTVS